MTMHGDDDGDGDGNDYDSYKDWMVFQMINNPKSCLGDLCSQERLGISIISHGLLSIFLKVQKN